MTSIKHENLSTLGSSQHHFEVTVKALFDKSKVDVLTLEVIEMPA